MAYLQEAVGTWLAKAEERLTNGGIQAAELQQLRQLLQTATPRQRLLYLHTKAPSV